MCTAIGFKTKDCYFGRNLDLECSYNERVVMAPRNFPFRFTNEKHYAIIGMASLEQDYPLYYDATNEEGLCIAGLNFPDNCVYNKDKEGFNNIPSFEFIPYVLSNYKNLNEVREALRKINITDLPFSSKFPPTPLHWLISYKGESITVEPMADGIRIYENKIGLLTNNPPFDYHLQNLSNYMNLTPYPAQNQFSAACDIKEYSRGMGAMGLPGDLSSSSRFVRAAFVKLNSVCEKTECGSISQFFHILDSVSQPRGANRLQGNVYEITVYSSCINADKGIYYYKTYDNSEINAVDMNREELDGNHLICYPLKTKTKINFQN